MDKDYELVSNFKTWRTDKTSIFDYMNSDVSEVNHTTSDENTYYCRTGETSRIITQDKQMDVNKEDTILFRARKNKDNKYELINVVRKKMKKNISNIENLDNKMWLVMSSENKEKFENKNRPYYLMENDIIKFGRKKYEVVKLNIPMNSSPYYEENSINYINKKHGPVFDVTLKPNQYCNEIITHNSNEIDQDKSNYDNIKDDNKSENSDYGGYNTEKDCRICFGSESTEENPKLKLCKCHSHIHYECLKKFLRTNLTINENKDNTVTSYKCYKFNCEVCEEPYPLKFEIKYKGKKEPKTYYLVDGIELPENTNYLILESLIFEKEKRNIKNIFVVKLTNRDINFGRNDANDIIDGDISISRFHAVFKYNEYEGAVTIVNKSKFGVLVLIRDNLKLETDEKIYFQVGKTFINVKQKVIENEEEKFINE